MNDKLIKLAYEFRDAELWEALADNDIFAVQLHDGKMGYCSVMGNSNCHYSLGLYIGETGWNSYLNNIRIAGQEDPEEGSQAMSEMDCINCDFTPMNEARKGEAWEKVVHFGLENGIDIKKHPGIPEFLRFRPYLYPGIGLNGDDELYMTEALRAALFIARQIGSCMHPMDLGFTLEGLHVSEKEGRLSQIPNLFSILQNLL